MRTSRRARSWSEGWHLLSDPSAVTFSSSDLRPRTGGWWEIKLVRWGFAQIEWERTEGAHVGCDGGTDLEGGGCERLLHCWVAFVCKGRRKREETSEKKRAEARWRRQGARGSRRDVARSREHLSLPPTSARQDFFLLITPCHSQLLIPPTIPPKKRKRKAGEPLKSAVFCPAAAPTCSHAFSSAPAQTSGSRATDQHRPSAHPKTTAKCSIQALPLALPRRAWARWSDLNRPSIGFKLSATGTTALCTMCANGWNGLGDGYGGLVGAEGWMWAVLVGREEGKRPPREARRGATYISEDSRVLVTGELLPYGAVQALPTGSTWVRRSSLHGPSALPG